VNDRLLREYIKLALHESARGFDGLALSKSESFVGVIFTLWDQKSLRDVVKSVAEDNTLAQSNDGTNARFAAIIRVAAYRSITQWVVGMIDLVRHHNELWNAWEVRASAARKGYGPLMYDIAMSECGCITSDRRNVSDSAERVWSHYFNRRPDVSHLPFDDIKNPQTPPVVDDARLHGMEAGQSPLDYAYEYEGASLDTSAAFARGDEAIKSIAKEFGIPDASLMGLVLRSGNGFFNEVY
jgi:hypothetical protein